MPKNKKTLNMQSGLRPGQKRQRYLQSLNDHHSDECDTCDTPECATCGHSALHRCSSCELPWRNECKSRELYRNEGDPGDSDFNYNFCWSSWGGYADESDYLEYKAFEVIMSSGISLKLGDRLASTESLDRYIDTEAVNPVSPDQLPDLLSAHVHKINLLLGAIDISLDDGHHGDDAVDDYFSHSGNLRHTSDIPGDLLEGFTLKREDAAFLRQFSKEQSIYSSMYSYILFIRAFSPFWIRPISSWQAPEGNDRKKSLISLLDHLFVKYPVPDVFYSHWLEDSLHVSSSLKWACIFILIGQGASLTRAAKVFKWHMPGKFIHYLYTTPAGYSINEACTRAEVLRLGGSDTEFRRLRECHGYVLDTTDNIYHDGLNQVRSTAMSFWRSTVSWLIRHRDALNDQMSRHILVWALHMHSEAEQRGTEFSWRGRSLARVHELAQEYSSGLARPIRQTPETLKQVWPSKGLDWQYQDKHKRKWSICEITSAQELYAEGRSMRHCVASYINSCINQSAAVFSLSLDGIRKLTIGINPVSRKVMQAKGEYNRDATHEEDLIIKKWRDEVLQVRAKKDG